MTGQEVTLTAALLSALGTLSGVVLHLWKKLAAVTEDLEKKLEHCETQHDVANKQILGLSVELAEIKGKTSTMTELKQTLIAIIKEQQNGQHKDSG